MRLLIAVLLPAVVYADVGQSYLGMCHPTWPCELSLQQLTHLNTGWLEHTFGEACPCAEKLLRSRKSKIVRIHLLNGPCLRNRRCGRYEPFYGLTIAKANRLVARKDPKLMRKITAIMKRASERLAKARQPLTCYVSTCLECDLGHEQRHYLAKLAANFFPQCSLVDSIVHGSCLPGFVCEKHGSKPDVKAPCIADLDGVTLESVSIKKYLENTKQCAVRYLWTYAYNCINGHRFVDPRKRNCKVAEEYFK